MMHVYVLLSLLPDFNPSLMICNDCDCIIICHCCNSALKVGSLSFVILLFMYGFQLVTFYLVSFPRNFIKTIELFLFSLLLHLAAHNHGANLSWLQLCHQPLYDNIARKIPRNK